MTSPDAELQKIFDSVDAFMRVMGFDLNSNDPKVKAYIRGARYRMAREAWDGSWVRIKSMRSAVYSMLFKKGHRKGAWSGENRVTKTCNRLCGCGWQQMRDHIESQFKPGMTWENHGRGKGKWSLDHIKPVSMFDWWTDEGLRAAFAWDNSQPLWNDEHRAKSNEDMKLYSARRLTDKEYAKRLMPGKYAPPLEGTDEEIMAKLAEQLEH